jgi:hypothetical protein
LKFKQVSFEQAWRAILRYAPAMTAFGERAMIVLQACALFISITFLIAMLQILKLDQKRALAPRKIL